MKLYRIDSRGDTQWNIPLIIGVVFAALFALIIVMKSYYVVQTGTVAVVYTNGGISEVAEPGLHFKVPFVDKIQPFQTIELKMTAKTTAASKDIQPITTEVSLNYRVDPSNVEHVVDKYGMKFHESIIQPRLYDTVKAVSAQYRSEELLANRELVKTKMTEILKRDLAKYKIQVESVQIVDFSFSTTFMKSIEDKLKAEQDSLRAKYELDRIKIEAQQKIAMAQAEAETIRIQSAAIRENGGAEYVKLKEIEKWNGVLPGTVYGMDIPIVNMAKQAGR